MKNRSPEIGGFADDESDFADWHASKERILAPARSPRRRAFEARRQQVY
jgi:hypothetical protein